MRLLAAYLLCLFSLAACESTDHVVSIDEQRDNGNDFEPRVRRVSGTSLVRIALFRPEQDPDGLYDAWRAEFEHDRRFDVVAQHAIGKAHYAPGSARCVTLAIKPDRLTATIEWKSTGARTTVAAAGLRQLADRVKLALRGPIAAE